MMDNSNIFRTLIKTLDNSGIITERTRPTYESWVDMATLRKESDRLIGYDIAEDAIADLRDINAGKRKVIKKISA